MSEPIYMFPPDPGTGYTNDLVAPIVFALISVTLVLIVMTALIMAGV